MGKRIPIDRIVDFAAGRLSKEEALALLDRIENDEQASRDLEMVTAAMDLFEKEGEALSAERTVEPEPLLVRARAFVTSILLKMRAHPVLSGAAAFAFV